ncbi:Glycosyltransferase involved in cell wall bisynthesis [Planococcus glaciei]|uniref:glycosyltransferase n=1 Tax=Planococcus glaciei TaxID=459472 RepID=UPI000887B836|nr:glycosyltransferase [Planococcus glaciei]SDI33720.1 Glycosyltransferase involved in cell wall bisynthesis [Planococcus glaciei]
MRNVLLVGEAYGGGVKTYIDTIMLNQEKEIPICFQALVSSKRLENNEGIDHSYLIENNMSFGKSPFKLIKALRTLHQVIIEKKIDIVHANSTFAGILIYLYSFLNRKPFYIYSPHGYYSFKSMRKAKKKLVRFVEKRINKSSDLIIHVSTSEEREAIENKLTKAGKSTVVLNGSKDPEVKAIGRVNDVFTIVNLARVDDPKNPFEFIEIARNILNKDMNVNFIWAGNGKYLEEARKKVKEYGLAEKVEFIGFSSEKEKIFLKSDLYLSTSQYEGLPFAVVEAMSYRLPLLLSNIIGHTDLVVEKENGLLFNNKEDHAIYEFVENLIQNPEQWEVLSNNSYRIFNDRFNINQMLKKLITIYQSV